MLYTSYGKRVFKHFSSVSKMKGILLCNKKIHRYIKILFSHLVNIENEMPHIYQFEKIIIYKRDCTVYTNFIHSKIKRKGEYVQ